jgi:hypothetical protein
MWVRCSPKGEVFIMYPRADGGNPHASYHLDGTLHNKSYGKAPFPKKRQPLTADFRDSENLGVFMGHGKRSGAVCDPSAFDGLVIVEPGILGPKHGSVGIDLIAAGEESRWERDIADRFYFGDVVQRQIFFAQPAAVSGHYYRTMRVTHQLIEGRCCGGAFPI